MTSADILQFLIQQAPYLAAVVFVVYLFLRYLQRWMDDWRAFFQVMRQEQDKVIVRLTEEIRCLSQMLTDHDAMTRESLAELRTAKRLQQKAKQDAA